MKPDGKPRYTIGQIMLGIAVFAGILALPRLVRSPDGPILFAFLGLLTTLVLISALFDVVFGKICPACGRRALRRLARHRHYYGCMACRARLKRFGVGPWLDASGPEDEARYHKTGGAGTWKEFAVPRDLKGSGSGVLLASKRARDPIEELHRYAPRPDSGRRLEQAERKVRAFLRRRNEIDE